MLFSTEVFSLRNVRRLEATLLALPGTRTRAMTAASQAVSCYIPAFRSQFLAWHHHLVNWYRTCFALNFC